MDLDINAQLENVSPERGGSSLQLSSERHSIQAAQLTPHKSTHVTDSTPPTLQYRNPLLGDASESQTSKRRKGDDYTATSTPKIPSKVTSHSTQTKPKKTPTLRIDMSSQMWLGFLILEALLIQKGKKELTENRTNEEFQTLGTPANEIHEFRTIRRAFPKTQQTLYSTERPDAVPGQHLHFTQIPMYGKVSLDTGLTDGFQVTVRFDGAYNQLGRKEVKAACIERLCHMCMPLGSTYSSPIDIGINTVTRNWAGYIKLHLQHPAKDGLALLLEERAFVLTMGDSEKTIGNVEKDFELITKARNMRLHLKGDTLRNNTAVDILRLIMAEAYYDGREVEILSLTKSEIENDFAFITLTTAASRNDILANGLIYRSEHFKVNITKDKDTGNISELRISTTLIATNLPQREPQVTITKTLKNLFGENNITGITFGYQSTHDEVRHTGWCHVQCLNTVVYTEWLRKSAYIFGRRINFISHKGSIDGNEPNLTAIRLAQAPICEVIAQKVQAMNNTATTTLLLSERLFTKTIKDLVETVDEKLNTLANTINLNTDKQIATSTDTLTTHATNIHIIMNAMALEFQHSNNNMHNIMQTLAATTPELNQPLVARLPQAPSTSMTNTYAGDMHLAPPGFTSTHRRSPHQTSTKTNAISMNRDPIDYPIKFLIRMLCIIYFIINKEVSIIILLLLAWIAVQMYSKDKHIYPQLIPTPSIYTNTDHTITMSSTQQNSHKP